MPRSIDGVVMWAQDDAHDRRDGGSWNSWCESFVFRAGGFTGSFPSALLAGNASGALDPNWGSAQRGEIHYWAGVGGFGHVAFELGGGLLLMASASVTDRWGVDMGTIPFRTYALKGIPYRGHTFRHGVETLAPTSNGDNELDAEQSRKLDYIYEHMTPGTENVKPHGKGIFMLLDAILNAPTRAPLKNKSGDDVTTGDMLREMDKRVEILANRPTLTLDDRGIAALAAQLQQQGIVATLDKDTLAAVGQAARAAIVKPS